MKPSLIMIQFFSWVADRPRSYTENNGSMADNLCEVFAVGRCRDRGAGARRGSRGEVD
jgi:hypothetical protein